MAFYFTQLYGLYQLFIIIFYNIYFLVSYLCFDEFLFEFISFENRGCFIIYFPQSSILEDLGYKVIFLLLFKQLIARMKSLLKLTS